MYFLVKRWQNFSLAKAFDSWREFTQGSLRKKYTVTLAYQQLYKVLLMRSMRRWKEYVELQRKNHLSDMLYHKNIRMSIIQHWKQFVSMQRSTAALKQRAAHHFASKIMDLAFTTWYKNVLDIKRRRRTAVERYRAKLAQNRLLCFQTWKVEAKRLKVTL
jgi:hypothetical protein